VNNRELIAYVPVIHQGYVDLFKSVSRDASGLWIIGLGLLNRLSVPREIRAVDPELICVMAKGLEVFENVHILEESGVANLRGKSLIVPDERVTRSLVEMFFSDQEVVYKSVFLRWHQDNVTSSQTIIPDRVSRDHFDRKMMVLADSEGAKSSDWWRHVGAIVVKDKTVLLAAYNQHEPSDQAQYVDGDPRDMLDAGTHNLLYGSIHAEQLLISEAARLGMSLEGTSLYINVFPCPECAKMISHSGIKKCYFKSGSAWLRGEESMKRRGVEIIRVD